MLEVLQLPPEIQFQIRELDDQSFDPDLTMRWYGPVQNALAGSLFMAGQAQHVVAKYGGEDLTSLESCSFVLHRFRREPVPEEDERSAIKEMLDELVAELSENTDLDKSLRDFLLIHARDMSRAFSDFFIIGSAGLRTQYEQVLGALVLRLDVSSYIQEAAKDEADSPGKRFWAILGRIALILSMATNIYTLGASHLPELLPGHSAGPGVTHGIVHQPEHHEYHLAEYELEPEP